MSVPSIVVAIIIILVIISFSTAIYFIFQKVKGKGSGGATTIMQQQQEEEHISEKKASNSPYAANVKPLMPYNSAMDNASTLRESQTSSTSTIPSTPIISSSTFEKTPVYERRSSQPIDDTGSSVWTATSETAESPPPPVLQDFKISLPLPPPSSSFFSDKIELDSTEANDLYASYLTVATQQQQQQQQQDFVSIDLDDKPFLSNAAANISQKAATLRSTLRQSMRRKSSAGLPKVALSQFFDNVSSSTSSVNKVPPSPSSSQQEGTRMSRNSSSTSSRNNSRSSLQLPPTLPPPPSPRTDSPASNSAVAAEFFGKFSSNNNSSRKSLIPVTTTNGVEEEQYSNKIMIDDDMMHPGETSYFSLPMSSPSTTNTTSATTPSTPSSLVMKTTIQEKQQQQEMLQQQQQEINYDHTQSQAAEVTASSDEEGPDKEEEEEDTKQAEAALAARRLIRTASRKSRTRSTLITNEAAQAMFTMMANSGSNDFATSTLPPTPPIQTAAKYATLRKHNMGIDTTLKRKQSNQIKVDTQKWTNKGEASSPLSATSTPSPTKRAMMSSITPLSGSATISGGKKIGPKQQQLKSMFNNNSNADNLLQKNNKKSMTLDRTSSAAAKIIATSGKEGAGAEPRSLRNLFTRPSMDESPITATSLNYNKDDQDDMGSNKSMVESDHEDNTEQEGEDEEETMHSAITGDISVLTNNTNTPNSKSVSPVVTTTTTKIPLQEQQPINSSPYLPQQHNTSSSATSPNTHNYKSNTVRSKVGNNVDTIRRMLQSSWSGNNLKESNSSYSLSSNTSSDYMGGTIGSNASTFRAMASPLGSINPRLQNQHLVSLSLRASNASQQSRRPSMPIAFMTGGGGVNDGGEDGGFGGRGPVPTASFSSSTVRTMIPAEEVEEQASASATAAVAESQSKSNNKKGVMENILGSGRATRQQQTTRQTTTTVSKFEPSDSSRKVAPMKDHSSKKSNHAGGTTTGKKTPAQIEREKYLKKSSLHS